MNDRNFSRRRRGGHRFRPSRGMGAPRRHPDLVAGEARTDATEEKAVQETIFDQTRHAREIDQAENRAAGVKDLPPPAPVPPPASPVPASDETRRAIPLKEFPNQGLVNTLKGVANRVLRRVERFVKPSRKFRKEIIVNAESLETRVAILEEGKLEEFNIERTSDERLVGSIFKGKVKNLEDGLKAAFVDIGFEKNAFLHYWDIVPTPFDSSVEIVDRGPRKREKPRITQRDIPRLFPPGSDIVVQVTKGPIGTKGPRVTTNLALPGRYLVLLPNSDQSGISRKIEDPQERQRLKKLIREMQIPDGMGVITRTAGEDQQRRYFVRDLALLVDEWRQIQERINAQPPPACVFREPDLIERTVRDFLTEDVDRIVVDNIKAGERIRTMIGRISKRSVDKVKLYTESQDLFDRFNITRQLENAFARQVFLRSGGYIVIDETEALVAIDVNTGRHKSSEREQESVILKVNLEAADEICRQLRLRNMGGLLILDFIDMKSRRDQQAVYQRMKEGLRRDRAKTHVLPISPLGLMEMTRQRHTESVREAVYDDCPYCKGRAKVKSALTMSVEIQRKLAEILRRRQRDESDFQLKVILNPSVFERLRTEDERLIIEMEKRYFGKLSFRPDPALHAEQFKIVNVATNEELANVGR